MFTVMIAEKPHLDSIHEYNIFLKPFVNQDKVAFCQWDCEAKTIRDAVPDLVRTVARHEQWRVVILCDEEGIEQRNPFDRVKYAAPAKPEAPKKVKPETDSDEDRAAAQNAYDEAAEKYRLALQEYNKAVLEAKTAAFCEAASEPLVRLVTHFCESPVVSGGPNNLAAKDPEYKRYLDEARRKEEIRVNEIIGEEPLGIHMPSEVYCIAMRTYSDAQCDLDYSWSFSNTRQYSRFYDWNLYFDKMRYLIFDILPKDHQNYTFDYIRFLYAALLFASNDVPADSLQPNRVYRLDCVNDEDALRRMIVSYNAKLAATENVIEAEIRNLESRAKAKITDHDVEAEYCASVTVPVTVDAAFDDSGLYADKKGIGLSFDCPKNEEYAWEADYLESERTLGRLFKQAHRGLRKSVESFHAMDSLDASRAKQMNAFQVEDVKEFVADSELRMAEVQTRDIGDADSFCRTMENENQKVRAAIDARMTRTTTIAAGVAVLTAFLAGFVPLFMGNRSTRSYLGGSLAVAGGGLLGMLLVGIVCLFCLRGALKQRIGNFNRVMGGIRGEVDGAMQQFSRYLSMACNVMRGASIINYFNEHDDADTLQIRIRRKHMDDIRRYREEITAVFGPYLTDPSFVDEQLTGPYLYDYSSPADFDYPMPFTEGEKRQIEYLKAGSTIYVPVDFVKRITVGLEELYD